MTHDSGTGGAPKCGVVSQMPVIGENSNPLDDLSASRSAADQAEIGQQTSSLETGITVQLAATSHTAMSSYEFPVSPQASVVVDESHVLLA